MLSEKSEPAETAGSSCKKLKLESLELRRVKFDLSMCYKIINRIVDLDFKDFFDFSNTGHNLRGNSFKLEVKMKYSNIAKNFFANIELFHIGIAFQKTLLTQEIIQFSVIYYLKMLIYLFHF